MSEKPPRDNIEVLSVAELVPDAENARKHTPRNMSMIEESLRTVGAARSIVIDEENKILAGNGVVEAGSQAGFERVIVIEASGRDIIAVRRSDLTEDQKAALALYDNRTSELSEWEPAILNKLAENPVLPRLWYPGELAELLKVAESSENNEEATSGFGPAKEAKVKPLEIAFSSEEEKRAVVEWLKKLCDRYGIAASGAALYSYVTLDKNPGEL